MKKAKTYPRSHALMVISLCFLGSAIIRGGAVAEAATDSLIMSRASTAEAAKPGGTAVSTEQCAAGPLIDMLKKREDEFASREKALNERGAKLDAAAKRLEERLAALENAREALEKTVAHVDGAQSRDIDRLVTMYATMKPKTAGALFNQMDVKFASELLVRMKPEMAAFILANMEPQMAFTASVMIARRNAEAPSE